MIAGIIIAYLYALCAVWLAVCVYRNHYAIVTFNVWHWICGQSHSAVWFKGAVFVVVFLSGMSLVGYIEAYYG